MPCLFLGERGMHIHRECISCGFNGGRKMSGSNKRMTPNKQMAASTTVLLIDDDTDNLDLLGTHLKERGVGVVVAHSADEALALYRLTPPDIIVEEMRLGLSDGYALIRTI